MLKCGALVCEEILNYELMSKSMLVDGAIKDFWYAGVLCPKCGFTHRISQTYSKKAKAIEQVKIHNQRVSKIH